MRSGCTKSGSQWRSGCLPEKYFKGKFCFNRLKRHSISHLFSYISVTLSATATNGSFSAVIYDDNGPNGGPGTVLDSQVVATPTAGSWYTVTPSSAVTVTSGAVYIGWYMTGGQGMNIGTRLNEPISRRTYEILGNSWAGYRAATTTDFMIRATITGYPCNHIASFNVNQLGLVNQFTNTSSGATSSVWDFGDGNTSTQGAPVHTYSAPGVYTVCLISSNGCATDTLCDTITACVNATAAFTQTVIGLNATFTDGSTDAFAWEWDFGDGNTSTQQSPAHTYAGPGYYDICLIASNICSADTMCMDSVLVCVDPVADFSFTIDSSGNASFTDLSSGFGTGAYAWDFGDGTTSTDQNPTHVYTTDGNFVVCLVFTDDCGSNTYCDTLNVGLTGMPVPLSDGGLTVYPNPSSGIFTLQGAHSSPVQLRVWDPMGRIVREENWMPAAGNHEIDLRDYSAGIYLLELNKEGKRYFRKLIRD